MATLLIPRPSADEYAPHYETYVSLLGEVDIITTLASQLAATVAPLRGLSDAQAMHRYAPGKWSVKEVIGHLADGERVFAYRAMRIARGDQTPLPSFDENAFVANARFDERTLADLLAEYAAVRSASVALFAHLTPDEMARVGTASGKRISVRALAWIVAGHELHHGRILVERYGVGA